MTTPYVPSPFKRDLTIPGDRSGRYQVVPHPLASGDFWIERILRPQPPPRTAADVVATGVRARILEALKKQQDFARTQVQDDPYLAKGPGPAWGG